MPFLNMPGAALKMSYVKWNRLFNPELITASSPVQVNTSAQGCRDAEMQGCRRLPGRSHTRPVQSSAALHCFWPALHCWGQATTNTAFPGFASRWDVHNPVRYNPAQLGQLTSLSCHRTQVRKSGCTHVLDKGTAKDNEPKMVPKELPGHMRKAASREASQAGHRIEKCYWASGSTRGRGSITHNCCWVRKKCRLNTAFECLSHSFTGKPKLQAYR